MKKPYSFDKYVEVVWHDDVEVKDKESLREEIKETFKYFNKLFGKKLFGVKEFKDLSFSHVHVKKNSSISVDVEDVLGWVYNSLDEEMKSNLIIVINTGLHLRGVKGRLASTTSFEFGNVDYNMITLGEVSFDSIRSAITHELGHVMDATKREGVVDQGERGKHCRNKKCIMYSPDDVSKLREVAKKFNKKIENSENVFCELCMNKMKESPLYKKT